MFSVYANMDVRYMKSGNRVFQYFNLRGRLSRTKPKGCGPTSKGTKIKYKGEPDIRIKHCQIKAKTKKTKRKTSKKKGKRSKRKK